MCKQHRFEGSDEWYEQRSTALTIRVGTMRLEDYVRNINARIELAMMLFLWNRGPIIFVYLYTRIACERRGISGCS